MNVLLWLSQVLTEPLTTLTTSSTKLPLSLASSPSAGCSVVHCDSECVHDWCSSGGHPPPAGIGTPGPCVHCLGGPGQLSWGRPGTRWPRKQHCSRKRLVSQMEHPIVPSRFIGKTELELRGVLASPTNCRRKIDPKTRLLLCWRKHRSSINRVSQWIDPYLL